ncbi:ferredoxin-fold anticodon-binding domain-containing protein 1-like [Saccoglossus kowalevskii]|uniref:Ferredoxin-fold anticodon-binding domain-containing protein 1-like n=1 Tax=Saccoglossus kowalevskii TaxID=10224 RepID=A0ABM0MI07_SACKO|nr:PREDICTED: ferredoxin-fold anticodon-binding domain-containing protein 1-like [Saccoglossus kowalevskii]
MPRAMQLIQRRNKARAQLQAVLTPIEELITQYPDANDKNAAYREILARKLAVNNRLSACVDVLHDDGEVHITLCKGQGGTPADKPARHWPNSWQVVAMAAYADLILTKAIPFDISDYPEYSSTGFRSQDKSFFTTNSLVHVFLKRLAIPTEPVQREFIQAVINGLNMEFNCPPCLAEYIHR